MFPSRSVLLWVADIGSGGNLILLANSVRPMGRDRVPPILRLDVAFPDRFRVRMDGRRVRIWLHFEFASSIELGEAAHPNRSQDQPGDVRRVPVHRLNSVSLDDLLVVIYVSVY
jgi:hypothetical protein